MPTPELTFQLRDELMVARRAATEAGSEPPDWALQPIPDVTYLGPRIGERGPQTGERGPRTS